MVVLAVLALLGGRLVQLQGLQATAYADQAAQQRLRTTVLPAVRGQILARDGSVIAVSDDARAIYAEPRTIAAAVCQTGATRPCTPAAIAAALAPVLHLNPVTLTTMLSGSRRFVYLARALEPALAKQVQALDLPGIGTLAESRRLHPAGQLAANVVGFTDIDGKGAAGVELGWQRLLAGVEGKATAEAGRDVELTIDRDLQWEAQRLLATEVAATGATDGSVVTMDVRTGQVLALATAPTFNPDDRAGVSVDAMGNKAISEAYEPGSVNKVITAAAALQAGVVTPGSVITVPPTYQVGAHTVHDAEQHGLEHLTFAGVLAKSSNIGTVQVAQRVGPQGIYDMLRAFGFGDYTGLGLPGESRGVIPTPDTWSGSSIATIPIGQGISANALQVASVYATVANGGVRVAPSIVRGTRDGTGRLTSAAAPAKRRVISADVAAQLRTMLEGVISDQGTAPLAAIPGYRVAGKTGTAQRVVMGRYDGSYTSSFVGFAPADAPRLVTAVVLQGTGAKGYFGGQVAAPVFANVMSFALRSMSIPPTGTRPPALRLSVD